MSFKRVYLLMRKELGDYFFSPLIYILAGLFSLITGWLFYNYLIAAKELTEQTLHASVVTPFFGNLNFLFLFLSPLLTMRLFSEEDKMKTLPLLLTSKLSLFDIIAGKFLAAFLSGSFLLSLTVIFPLILYFSGYSNWPVIGTGYLGILFSLACYLSVGIFSSTLTENQIASSLISFCVLFGLMLLVLTGHSSGNRILSQMFAYFTVPYHFEGFVRGVMRSYNFVFFFSFMGFFSGLSYVSLGSRKW